MGIKFDEIKERLEKINKEKELVMAELQKDGQKVLKDLFLDFLAKTPEIHSLRWVQYTPHFNDGDSCEFSVHGMQYRKADYDEDNENSDQGDFGNGYFEYYSQGDDDGKPWFAALKEIEESWSSLGEDMMRNLFGDGVQVTVTREGIEVDDYDHD